MRRHAQASPVSRDLAFCHIQLLPEGHVFDFDAISIEAASDFRCLEPPTDALPPGPDFMFGSPARQVLTSYYASRYLHEIGVYRCEGVILEDGALMRGDGGYIVAPQVNLHG